MAKRTRKRKQGWPRIFRRGNGVYYAEWGRCDRESLGTRDEDEAYRKVAIKVELRKKGKLVQLDRAKRIRLSEFRTEYLAERERQLAMGEIAAATLRMDGLALARLMDTAGDIAMRQVTIRTVDDFKAKLLAGAKDVKKRMRGINVYLRHLRAAFNWAAWEDPERGRKAYIARNPFAKEKGRKPVEFNTGRRMPRFSEWHELQAILGVIDGKRQKLEATLATATGAERKQAEKSLARLRDLRHLVEFFPLSGLRRIELVSLQWPDIKFDLNVIHVTRTKRMYERMVPMHPRVREIAVEMGPKDLGPVFPRWRSADHITRMFTALAREAGVNKTLHSMRHSFGSYAAMSGIDLRTIQRWMGHQDIRTTQIYADISEEHSQEQMLKLKFGRNE